MCKPRAWVPLDQGYILKIELPEMFDQHRGAICRLTYQVPHDYCLLSTLEILPKYFQIKCLVIINTGVIDQVLRSLHVTSR